MYAHRINEKLALKTYVDWLLLSFLAGAVNAGGFLAGHRFVSHVTGFATLAGIDWAEGNWSAALGVLTVPLYFLAGVMLSAYLIDRRRHLQQRPLYEVVMGLVTLSLALVTLGGLAGFFGDFGKGLGIQDDYLLLALLCGASGLQNAALTSASGATIRTTHLTGLTTDMGIGIIRAAWLPRGDARRMDEMRANGLRLGTIVSFMSGSGAGAALFLKHGYWGFALPAAIGAYATAMAVVERRKTLEIERRAAA